MLVGRPACKLCVHQLCMCVGTEGDRVMRTRSEKAQELDAIITMGPPHLGEWMIIFASHQGELRDGLFEEADPLESLTPPTPRPLLYMRLSQRAGANRLYVRLGGDETHLLTDSGFLYDLTLSPVTDWTGTVFNVLNADGDQLATLLIVGTVDLVQRGLVLREGAAYDFTTALNADGLVIVTFARPPYRAGERSE